MFSFPGRYWIVPVSQNGVALLARDLKKQYKDVVAVGGVDLDVRKGECFGLLGPNGAGKTTTIEICEGLVAADAGQLEVLGLRWTDHARELRQRLGVQLQDAQFSERLTVAETIRLFRSFYERGPRVEDLQALVGLTEKCGSRVGNLSGGQKQRLALACALAGDPDLLFLDEPTTGLDPHARRQLWDLMAQFKLGGRTIVLTTHYMDEAERLCDRVAIMDRGKLIALGTPRELIATIGASHIIEFSSEKEADIRALPEIPGIQEIRRENGEIRVLAAELHESVPALLRELSRQEVALTSLRTRSAALEDVFVTLTGRRLRDD
jgi:ABC-2 type transport system ATP-binding protein